MKNSLAGKILISSPHIDDPRFEKTVIFICAHDEEGAMGLTINKRLTDLNLFELLAESSEEDNLEKVKLPVFIGGPLEPERGFLLHSSVHNRSDSTIVGDDFGVSGTLDTLKSISSQDELPKDVIFALGYAGWGNGQLEKELKEDVWLMIDASKNLVFEIESESLWDTSMSLLGVDPLLLATHTGQA